MTADVPLMRTGRAMAIATMVSRVTGFVRTMVLVAALGLGTRLLDAYTAANVTPNAIYELVMGGAVASVVVPLLVRTAADDSVDADLTTGQMLLLSIGTSGGVAAQMAVLAVTSGRTGFRLRLHADPRGIAVRRHRGHRHHRRSAADEPGGRRPRPRPDHRRPVPEPSPDQRGHGPRRRCPDRARPGCSAADSAASTGTGS